MVKKSIILMLCAMLLLAACDLTISAHPGTDSQAISSAPPLNASTTADAPVADPQQVIIDSAATPTVSEQQAVLDRAFEVIAAIKSQDTARLATFVHPAEGLRFSPYAYVSDTDQVFPPDQVAALPALSRTFIWGAYSGSGAPIDGSWYQYYSEFVYDQDFAVAPEISLNHRLGVSTSMDNIVEYYKSSMVVEFYFPGFDPQFQGMDWRSLRLVFTQYSGAWYLVGVVHDQWTT